MRKKKVKGRGMERSGDQGTGGGDTKGKLFIGPDHSLSPNDILIILASLADACENSHRENTHGG